MLWTQCTAKRTRGKQANSVGEILRTLQVSWHETPACCFSTFRRDRSGDKVPPKPEVAAQVRVTRSGLVTGVTSHSGRGGLCNNVSFLLFAGVPTHPSLLSCLLGIASRLRPLQFRVTSLLHRQSYVAHGPPVRAFISPNQRSASLGGFQRQPRHTPPLVFPPRPGQSVTAARTEKKQVQRH